MSWRLKIVLCILLGFVLGAAQTWWERRTQAASSEAAQPAIPGTTLV